MHFHLISALCVTPIAFAATLQADLAARGIVQESSDLAARGSSNYQSPPKDQSNNGYMSNSGYNSNSNDNSQGGSNNNGGNTVVVNNVIEENNIVLIWKNEGGGSETSTVTQTVTVTENGGTQTSTMMGGSGGGATHSVMVGGSAGLVYTPPTIEAAVGDAVIFTFMSQNHTATQSSFNTPCEKMEGGVDTGFMPNMNNTVSPPPQMAMQVMTTTPTWFYCRQTGHCGKAMVFSINPTANKTQEQFAQMAVAQNGTGTASAITGGSAAPPPPPPPPPPSSGSSSSVVAPPPPQSSATMVQGQGSMSNGVLECSCQCGVDAFPSALQGQGMVGGMAGSMPMAMMEKI